MAGLDNRVVEHSSSGKSVLRAITISFGVVRLINKEVNVVRASKRAKRAGNLLAAQTKLILLHSMAVFVAAFFVCAVVAASPQFAWRKTRNWLLFVLHFT